MDKTLDALSDLLLKALPTFFLVVFLYFYLRKIFFQPLDKVLEARRDATEGTRARAEAIFRKAEEKAAQYEAALQSARSEIYREQESERQKALGTHAARIREVRSQAEAQLRQARERIAEDVAAAKQTLAGQADTMAEQVIRVVLAP